MNKKLTQLWATKTKDDEWWSSFVTSPIAIALNYFVVDIKWLTPNKITLISFLIAIIAAVFIIWGGTYNFIIAAVLIHLSHVFDCMDGQMARYRKTTSVAGGYFDKLTDEIQVALWFGAISYAAYSQSQQVLPIILAFIGVVAYAYRGYVKYVTLHTQLSHNNNYLNELVEKESIVKKDNVAGLGFNFGANLRWFMHEQVKIIYVNEGVFIFMLSFALIINSFIANSFILMLWVFAISQVMLAMGRTWRNNREISLLDQNNIPEPTLDFLVNSSLDSSFSKLLVKPSEGNKCHR